jgi:hypothetical protein
MPSLSTHKDKGQLSQATSRGKSWPVPSRGDDRETVELTAGVAV